MRLPWQKDAAKFDPKDPTILTNILQRMGVLTPEQVQRALGIRTTGLIGQVLIGMRYCTEEQLDEALWQQRVARKKLSTRALVTGTLERATRLQEQTARDFHELAELATSTAKSR